ARKTAAFEQLKAWVNGSPERKAKYGADVAATDALLAEREAIARAEYLLGFATPSMLGSARQLYQLAQERAKPDAERKPGYQDRDLPRIR
ncbi:S46 family peptidase, partial [Stenotrophomonas maltophilia]